MVIEASSQGLQSEFFSIKTPRPDSVYLLNFILDTLKNYLLKPILIQSSQAIQVKDDTVVYNVDSFVRANDRTVEDLLKRLPGIEVDSKTGIVKYRGKSIETMLLEGDNLFGYNYTTGTRNINIGIIEQIEAIDNYSENPLLKNIEETDKVALNLKLKSGMADFSGNIDMGLGMSVEDKLMRNFNGSVMEVSKAVKSFGTISLNNVGANQSTFDYFSTQFDLDKLNEDEFLAKKVIQEIDLSNFLDESLVNNNNLFYSSANSIFKIGKRVSLKLNLNYVNDDIRNIQSLNSINSFNGQFIEYSNLLSIKKKPELFKSDLYLKFNSSPTSLIEYKVQVRPEAIHTTGDVFSNDDLFSKYDLKSKDLYLKHSFLYTKKVSDKSALQFVLQKSNNIIEQIYEFSPSVINADGLNNDIQNVNPERKSSSVRIAYLSRKGSFRYSKGFGYTISKYNLLSRLNITSNDGLEAFSYGNSDMAYNKETLFNFASLNWKFNKVEVSGSYMISLLKQKLIDQIIALGLSDSYVFIEPSLFIKYTFSQKYSLLAKVSYNQFVQNEDYINNDFALINNRTLVANTPSLNLQKRSFYMVTLRNNDLENQVFVDLSFRYSMTNGNYISDYSINENLSKVNNIYDTNTASNFTSSLMMEKFVSSLSTTFRLHTSYNFSNYYNIINSSFLRNNFANNWENGFSIVTAFDSPINFENNCALSRNWSFSSNSNVFKNVFLSNKFSIFVEPLEDLRFTSTIEYYAPNLSNRKEIFSFLDAFISYKLPDRKGEFTLVGKNILDLKYISNTQTTDYSLNTQQIRLLRFYCLLNFTFSF